MKSAHKTVFSLSVSAVLGYFLLEIFSNMHLSELWGFPKGFSLFSLLAPALASSTAGWVGLLIAFARRFFWQTESITHWILRAAHIPTVGAVVYWHKRTLFISLIVPMLCMGLFCIHPIGAQAWPYALYWIIPMGAFLFKRDSLFFTALGSTFTAHALGSVIWLYTIPMTSGQWLALIPVVARERLITTVAMVFFFYAWRKLDGYIGYYSNNYFPIIGYAKKKMRIA